jgi:hypothetical protein
VKGSEIIAVVGAQNEAPGDDDRRFAETHA